MVAAADLRSCDLCGALVAPGAEAPPAGEPTVCDTCLKTRRVIVEAREPEGARSGARRVLRFDCPHCRRRLQSKAIARRTEIRCPRCERPFAVLPGGGVEPLAAFTAPAAGPAASPVAPPPAPAPAHRRPAPASGERPAASLKAPVVPRRPSGERPALTPRDGTPMPALAPPAAAPPAPAPAAPLAAAGAAPAARAHDARPAPTSARLAAAAPAAPASAPAPAAAAVPAADAGPMRPSLALLVALLLVLLPPAIGGIAALSAARATGFAVREPLGPPLERAGARFRRGVDALAAKARGPVPETPAPGSPEPEVPPTDAAPAPEPAAEPAPPADEGLAPPGPVPGPEPGP